MVGRYSQRQLLIAHQVWHAEEEATEGGVHWGGVMSNMVRSVPLGWLTDDASKLDQGLYYLGQPERATGFFTTIGAMA